MAREKVRIRREGQWWVCRTPSFGFTAPTARYFRTWQAAMNWGATQLGAAGCADLALSGQLHDAIGSVPMWTPVTFH